jgi:hypothetical protein
MKKLFRRLRKQADETIQKSKLITPQLHNFLKNYIKKEFNKELLYLTGVDTRAFYKTDNKSNKIFLSAALNKRKI